MYDAWLGPENRGKLSVHDSGPKQHNGLVGRALGFAVGLYLASLLLIAI